MLPDKAFLRQRVQEFMPELVIDQFETNQEGLANELAIVNRELVFRFPRSENFAKILDDEMRILDLVRPPCWTGCSHPSVSPTRVRSLSLFTGTALFMGNAHLPGACVQSSNRPPDREISLRATHNNTRTRTGLGNTPNPRSRHP